ncbi:hypothetical protein NHX12_022508 [Muraenolepis orangiensis]|uniref:FAM21/CAPZIP domain-containing protein n=1 Tax=Muraenolepis orangiensis TaxID=630683 RepID=A0A9Q0ENQ5_9TELE|nr:hypothetical protein NHX12_022508 [Muraenolepis orangiensis]
MNYMYHRAVDMNYMYHRAVYMNYMYHRAVDMNYMYHKAVDMNYMYHKAVDMNYMYHKAVDMNYMYHKAVDMNYMYHKAVDMNYMYHNAVDMNYMYHNASAGLLFSPALLTRGFRSEHKAAAGMPSAEHCGGPALSPTPSAKSPGRQKKHSAGTHIEDLTVTVKDAKDPSLRNLPIPIVRLAKLDMGRLFSSISADGGLKIPVSSPLKKPDKHDYEVAEVNTPQLHPEKEMMQRAANPANTPEKTAYLEPTTPILSRRHTIPNNTCQSTATALHCRTKLDQMLKEIHCVKRSKEKETQLLSWCREEGLRGAEREEDQTIFPEHQEFLQRFSVVSNVIREVHPGEVVFNLGSSGRLFSQDTLQLRHCNAQPHGAAQKTLLWSSPAQLSLHVRIGLFEEAYHASPCPPQVSGFLFKMMSVHTERMISDKILQALVADMTLVLLNMGASFVTLFPLETFQPPFNEADLLNDLNMRNECPSSNPKRTFPKHNFTNVLKYLSYCMALCPRAFSDPELLLLLALSSQLGLEVLFSLEPHTDLRCLQRHVLRNVRDWEDMLPRMCRALTELTTDHHNMCSLVQLLPDHPRGKQLRRHLSVCMISKLLDGRCAEKPPGREVQLTDLSPYLSRITPSSLLRSMLSSTAQKEKEENMDTLDQQSYYLCYSLLTLVNQASNYQSYQPHQKEQLLELCSEMDRHIKRDLNKNVKCLNRSKVSDLVARIYTKWLMLIQRITPLHLFLFLQDFSQRMLSKTHAIEKQLDGLIRDTKATDSCLHSVFNDFLMLSNTQFIENRVYDEEVEEPSAKVESAVKHPEQSREQKEAALIPKMQEAVNYGLRVLDSAFEQLDIKAGNSDSEEEEEASDRLEAILEPKDLYVDRPLPYLIGSQAFMDQEDVGLGDLSSDEMSIESDRDSIIESEDGKEEVPSDEDFEEAQGRGNITKKSSAAGSSSFVEELAARIKGEAVSRGEEDRASLASSKKKDKSKKVVKAEKMEDEDEDFSPFGGRGGLFSGGRGLFDDDDEGDLFTGAPKPAGPQEQNKGAVQKAADSGLFDSGNITASVEVKEKGSHDRPPAHPAPREPPTRASGIGGGLFDEEEDDDFFRGRSLKTSRTFPESGQEKSRAKKVADLFLGDEDEDEEEGDLFGEKSAVRPPVQSNKAVVEEKAKPPEKKNGPPVEAPVNQTRKPQTRGLFSDDEDTPAFPTTSKSQSAAPRPAKAPVSLFDDEEEEDLFASVAKSKPTQAKASTPQPQKTGSLFSDDEDQWLSSGRTDSWSGGMKASVSAPSNLPSVTTPPKGSLFHPHQDPHLFATTKTSSPMRSQRVALLFEDESDDEDKGFLFGSKPVVSSSTKVSVAEAPAVPPEVPSLFDQEPRKEVVVSGSVVERAKPTEEATVEENPPSASPRPPGRKQPSVGTLGLFGSEGNDGDFLSKDQLPPPARNTMQPAGEPPRTRSTGVFQDEELLFSDTQQKDNDPEVDLFATSRKPVSAKPSSVKTDMLSVFSDDEDLFSSVKPKPPHPKIAKKPSQPKVDPPSSVKGVGCPSPPDSQRTAPTSVTAKDPLTRIGKLQASLLINPTALLPGTAPPGLSPRGLTPGSSSGVSSLSPSPLSSPLDREEGVSFESPLRAASLQSTNKSRAKGSGLRRPQSRAARQQAAQRSALDPEDGPGVEPGPGLRTRLSSLGFQTPGGPSLGAPGGPGLGGAPPPGRHVTPTAQESTDNDQGGNPPLSIFDELATSDLFQKVKPRAQKAKASSFMEDHDDDEDIFGMSTGSTPSSTTGSKTPSSPAKQDIFQDDESALPKAGPKKHKEKTVEVSLFDDNVDIFADLTPSSGPKEKSKKKAEARWIFEDDLDDIFSSNKVKAVAKAPKARRTKPTQEGGASESGHAFHDPLNALGGN